MIFFFFLSKTLIDLIVLAYGFVEEIENFG